MPAKIGKLAPSLHHQTSTGRSTRRRVSSVSNQQRQHALDASGAQRISSSAARQGAADDSSVLHSSSEPSIQQMSLSRSPSPQRSGGWSSPGLSNQFAHSRSSSPVKTYTVNAPHTVTWASAQARSAQVNGYPAYKNAGMGFFRKHMRSISSSLPFFNQSPQDERFAEKEKLGRGRWQSPPGGNTWSSLLARIGRLIWRLRLRFAILLAFLLSVIIFYATRE